MKIERRARPYEVMVAECERYCKHCGSIQKMSLLKCRIGEAFQRFFIGGRMFDYYFICESCGTVMPLCGSGRFR
jgi:hypothetical protein